MRMAILAWLIIVSILITSDWETFLFTDFCVYALCSSYRFDVCPYRIYPFTVVTWLWWNKNERMSRLASFTLAKSFSQINAGQEEKIVSFNKKIHCLTLMCRHVSTVSPKEYSIIVILAGTVISHIELHNFFLRTFQLHWPTSPETIQF